MGLADQGEPASETELAVAAADFACKLSSGLLAEYRAAGWRERNRLTGENRPMLERAEEVDNMLLARAQGVVARYE